MAVSIDYTSRDYDSLRASMLKYADRALPEWTTRSPGDLGVLMVELEAYVGDILSYYLDRAADEAYLSTATLDSSVVALANMLGYSPQTGVAATGTVTLSLATEVTTQTLVPKGALLLAVTPTGETLGYETTAPLLLGPNAPLSRTGTIGIRHGVTVTKRPLGTSEGRPGTSFILDDNPIVEDSLEILVDYADDKAEPWTRVPHLGDAGPDDKVYTVALSTRRRLRIIFGDGVNGAVPSPLLGVYASYIKGGGSIANLPAGQEYTLAGAPNGVSVQKVGAVFTTSATRGGLDADDREDIRRNVPAALRTRDRAVALDDYNALALADPAIIKANAVTRNPMAVYIYTLTTDDREVDARVTRARVQKDLARRAPTGTAVALFPAIRKSFTIGGPSTPELVNITAYDNYENVTVQIAVNQALINFYATANTYLGQPILASDIYRTIIDVEGVRSTEVPRWRLNVDGAPLASVDTVLQPWELPVLIAPYVTVSGGIV